MNIVCARVDPLYSHQRTPLGLVLVIFFAKTARSTNPALRVLTLQSAPVCAHREGASESGCVNHCTHSEPRWGVRFRTWPLYCSLEGWVGPTAGLDVFEWRTQRGVETRLLSSWPMYRLCCCDSLQVLVHSLLELDWYDHLRQSVGQRRRWDPLKLADKINRSESFYRRHWPYFMCFRECLVVLALFRFRSCNSWKTQWQKHTAVGSK
jgi:hypothetical protein